MAGAHHHGHHGHSHAVPTGDRAILWAVIVNLALTGAQIVGGVIADSTALIADGVHNLSDAMALVLAFGARRLARRPATPDFSFGWGRVEIIAAFVNFIALIAVSIWLAVEALGRLANPPEVAGGLVMGLASFALIVDLATAALVYRSAKESVNIRAAFLHNLADAGVSVAVILGGALIWAFGWYMADPILTLLISVVIVWHIAGEIGPVFRSLMLGAPPGIDSDEVLTALRDVPGAADAHHLHLWQIDEKRNAASVHLVIETETIGAVVRSAKGMLLERFAIHHSTIEVELPGQYCADEAGEGQPEAHDDHDHAHGHDHDHKD